jgi:putative transposase
MRGIRDVSAGTKRLNRQVKSIKISYKPSEELRSLFGQFRLMCNDAIRIAVEQNPRNRFALIESAYQRLKEYGLHTHYILSACEVAYSVYRNKNRRSDPYVKRTFLKLTNQSYCLNHLILRIPAQPRHFIYLALQASEYHLSFIEDPSFKKGSITLVEGTASISLSKEIEVLQIKGLMGVDVNERNVTTSDSLGGTRTYNISQVPEIRERYKETRARIGRRIGHDCRISRRLYAKCGTRERDRSVQVLHRVSKTVVREARRNQLRIVLEKLSGIRKLYRKGNGQGASFRGRMNSWAFHELQRQIEYKAKWEGMPVTYVNPRGTSRKCPDCGSRVVTLRERKLFCAECDKTWDRDVLASKNIMACAVPQVRPSKWSSDPACMRTGEQMDGSLFR